MKELEAQLTKIIEEAFAAMFDALEAGVPVLDALGRYYTVMEEMLEEFHQRAYRLGQEEALGDEDDPLRRALVGVGFIRTWPKGIDFQLQRLRIMLDEIAVLFEVMDEDIRERYHRRALMYARAIWNPYQRGRIYFDDDQTRYLWRLIPGNTSDRSCKGCIEQRAQPPRTLAEMNYILPGDEECGGNCRDMLVVA